VNANGHGHGYDYGGNQDHQKHGATGEEMHHPTWLLPQMLPGHQPLWATACHLLQPVKETLMSNKVANSVKQRI
jgi:hypothetical protein